MFVKWFSPAWINYQKVNSNSEEGKKTKKQTCWAIAAIFRLAILSLAATLGFFAGRHVFPSEFLLLPAGNVRQVWQYNQTFAQSPSNQSEAAWSSIFPRGHGFFTHPSIQGNISLISVFHELHCLSAIRLAYYSASEETFVDNATEDDTTHASISLTNSHHIHHCFDYLRQALMCATDTNLEIYDWNLGGSTGWGVERICRDYDAVVAWAEKWRPKH